MSSDDGTMFVDDDTASVQGQLEDPLAGGRGVETGDIFECPETRRRMAEIYRLLAIRHTRANRAMVFDPLFTFNELKASNTVLERNITRVEDQLDHERHLAERRGQELNELRRDMAVLENERDQAVRRMNAVRRERDALVDDNTHLRAQIADLTNQVNGGQNIDIIEI